MKKTLFTLAAVLLLCAGCDRVRQYLGKAKDKDQTKDIAVQPKDEQQAGLQFIHLAYNSPDSMVSISADVPTTVGTPLADSIMKYVGENFEAFTTIYNESHDARQAFRYTGEGIHTQMLSEIAEQKADIEPQDLEGMEWMFNWSYENELTQEYDCQRYVTYVNVGDNYTGGAHGFHWVNGTTFDKETGKRIGKEILKNTDSQAFRTLFQRELLKYFTETDSDEGANNTLSDYLLIDINDLQISNMRITDRNFVFQYQPYEISYYAAGLPVVILTFEQMKPYLTTEGLRLIGMEQEQVSTH
ncbi:MAG: DUF3298 domain-containing protein [Prevotella sp.]|nr:DUF3298 domain-containing protein [Prevotella sp.]